MLHRKRKIYNECDDILNKKNITFNTEGEKITFIDKILKQYLDFGKNISILIDESFQGEKKEDKFLILEDILNNMESENETSPDLIEEKSEDKPLYEEVDLPKKKGRRPNK